MAVIENCELLRMEDISSGDIKSIQSILVLLQYADAEHLQSDSVYNRVLFADTLDGGSIPVLVIGN